MIIGLDTDILVHWSVLGTSHHRRTRRFIESKASGNQFAITPQVLFEFVHICTDFRRFTDPLTMEESSRISTSLWKSREVVRILPEPGVVQETFELMKALGLGRKRILDTALAVTLKQSGVRHLATYNKRDYEAFDFLTLITP